MATKNRTFYAYKIVNETVSHATSVSVRTLDLVEFG